MLIRREDFKEIGELTKGSHKKVWFICDKCGVGVLQRWQTYIQSDEDLCRKCRNKKTANLSTVKEKQSIASKKNWKNREYREKITSSLSKGCQKAWDSDDGSRRLAMSERSKKLWKDKEYAKSVVCGEAVNINEIKELLESLGYTYLDRKFGERGGQQIKYQCDKGHIEWKRLDSFRAGHKCAQCFYENGSSQAEKEILDFIKTLKFEILVNDRSIINPLELDIVIPEKKIAIEYCGLYWHSEQQGKDKKYHLNKLESCNDAGYRLITIFEDEWIKKSDIVKTRLTHILGESKDRIYARQCEIKEIDVKIAKPFVEKYHIQGYTGARTKLGAFYNGELVSVMTFAKPSLAKGSKNREGIVWEISRFCSSLMVVGIASKLFKHFQRNYEWDEIYSYADRRWSDGNVYEKIGMNFDSITQPNYWYWKPNEMKRIHRFALRKRPDEPKNVTERILRDQEGYYRIWDCGNLKYVVKR